jgi:lipoprotein-anchoring transpeptidase ErfK/SrfK
LLAAQLDGRTPEGQLILTYQQLARGQEAQAFATVSQLVKEQPNFALAQLVYGDMLMARSGQEPKLGAESGREAAALAERAAGLRAESRLRLAALVERPPIDAMPKELLNLSPLVKHAIVVDTSRARLYLFENVSGTMKLVSDSYVSVGKLGTGKMAEGDLRTPLGTYHVGMRREEAAERYGAAVLPLNYPNEYDRVLGRGGSSIWLHGERAGSYARGPRSTDGCIVLSNDEMSALADRVEAFETPVVIVNHVDWVKKSAAKQVLSPAFEQAYDQWQKARLQQNAAALRGLYEPGLQRGSDSEAERLKRNLERMARQELPLQSLERLSVMPWQDQQSVVIVTYREIDPQDAKPKLKRQYWREHEGQWRILFDGLVG